MKCFIIITPEQEILYWSYLVKFSSLTAKEAKEKLNLYFLFRFSLTYLKYSSPLLQDCYQSQVLIT